MRYIVGVDGGGTKTEIVLCDQNGCVVERKVGNSSNPNDIGKEQAVEVVANLLREVLPKNCTSLSVGLGISGLFSANCEDFFINTLKKDFSVIDEIKAYSDKDSCFNSVYDKDGCIVIMGTGSVGVVRKNGVEHNFGGGGYLIDDGFSGFDLGKSVINSVLSAFDCGEQTVLSDLFYAKTGENVRKHIKTIYQLGKPYIASFAPLLFEGLVQNDFVAKKIFSQRVEKLEQLLLSIYDKWAKDKCEITFFGGLTKKLDVIKNYFSENIKNKIIVRTTNTPITYGLIKEFCKSDLDLFIKTYKKA